MNAAGRTVVKGNRVDAQTRCAHYHSALDIVAIQMKCCGEFYACKDCHEELAGHSIEVWPRSEWSKRAVLCGACRELLTIHEYLGWGNRCPACGAAFNPKCKNHFHFYFGSDTAEKR